MPTEDYDESLFPEEGDYNEAQEAWNAGTEEMERGRPVGTFQADITVAELGRSASSDRLQIHYALTIVGGPSEGIEVHKYDGLETPQQASITQQQLKRLGVDINKVNLKKLPAVLLDLVGARLAITCRQNNEFYNIFFNKRLGETLGGKPAAAPSRPARGAKKRARRAPQTPAF